MYVAAGQIATLAAEVGLPAGTQARFATLCIGDAALAEAFVRAHQRCESEPSPLERESTVADVLMTLLRRHASEGARQPERPVSAHAVRRAVAFIQDCYSERLTLDRLAEAAGMSRFGVLRAFRREVGISPYAFVMQVRVEQAKLLLREGVDIAAVALRVGFSDQSHLTRKFKRLVGMTPGAYAQAARAT